MAFDEATFEKAKEANPVAGGGFDEAKFEAARKQKPAARTEEKAWIPGWMKRGALPTVGAILGGAGGGMMTSPTVAGVPLGVVGGEMAGAALGEKANQMFGITEPSTSAVVGSAVAAPIGRAGAAAVSGIGRTIVKTIAGRELMSEGAINLLKKWLSPTVSAKSLFAEAGNLEMSVPATKTITAIDEVLKSEVDRAPTAIREEILEAVKPLRNYFIGPAQMFETTTPKAAPVLKKIVMGESGVRGMETPASEAVAEAVTPVRKSLTGKLMSVPEMMEESQRLRYLSGKAYEAGNSKLANALNSVRSAMLDDLEQSGAGIVKDAAKAYRKEMALEDLSRLLSKPKPLSKIRDFATENPLFKGAFSEPEMAQIERIARRLAYVPPSGGSGTIGRIVMTTAGAAEAGVPGGLVGYLGPDAIRALLGTQFGRNFTERILGSSPTLNHEIIAALSVFAKGMMSHPVQHEGQDAAP